MFIVFARQAGRRPNAYALHKNHLIYDEVTLSNRIVYTELVVIAAALARFAHRVYSLAPARGPLWCGLSAQESIGVYLLKQGSERSQSQPRIRRRSARVDALNASHSYKSLLRAPSGLRTFLPAG